MVIISVVVVAVVVLVPVGGLYHTFITKQIFVDICQIFNYLVPPTHSGTFSG